MNQDMLSVVIPAYNAEKYLEEAVGSVRSQTWDGEMEILLVDDGSSDGTRELGEKLGCRLFSQTHGGAASARNRGLSEARGEWILFLDADDVMRPGALEALKAPFLSDRDLMLVAGRAQDFISPDLTPEERAGLHPRDGAYDGRLTGVSLIRRPLFDRIGPFDAGLKSGETVDWMMRVREAEIRTLRIEDTILMRRLHLSNTGRVERKQEMANYAALLRKRMKKS